MTSITNLIQRIEEMADESWCDGYHLGHDEGYDEAWDKARDKGFDEGYEEGYKHGRSDQCEDDFCAGAEEAHAEMADPDVWITYKGRCATSSYMFSTKSRTAPEVLELREMIKEHNADPYHKKLQKRVMLAPRGPRGAWYNGRYIPNFYQSWLPEKSGQVTHYDVYVYYKHWVAPHSPRYVYLS